VWIISSTNELLVPTAIALGNFDGVHLGHQQVLKKIIDHQANSGDQRPYPTVVSFNPHPRQFFTGQHQPLLTPLEEKVAQLESLGIAQLVLLPFSQALANLVPQEFVETILFKQLQAQKISVGADFRFGYQRQGTAQDLTAIAAQFGIEVFTTSLQQDANQRISSSLIRSALAAGDMEQANRMLGRPYGLVGKVIYGQQLGRTLGFPTANLALPEEKLLPRFGVYCVRVHCPSLSPHPLGGVMNLGDRPTVDGQKVTAEIHLFNFSDNLYDQSLRVELLQFLRPEQKFSGLDSLKAQIAQDCQQAQAMLLKADLID
jgi:riboflavin kinase/FMN adenylyltransferase